MHLKSLSLINFKNYAECKLDLNSKANCIVGNNGQGKTNILDAIYYLSFCKSYFNPIDSQNIFHNSPFFVIQGLFEKNEQDDEIYCGLKRNQKKQFKRNKKEYERLSDHIGHFPVVMISPSDSELITEGSESRRKFIDSIISQYDRDYLEILIQYNRVVSQRNSLLKEFSRNNSFNDDTISIWDEQLIPLGEKIYKKRKEFITRFIPIFQKYYDFISGGKENIDLNYISHLNEKGFREKLIENQKRDLILEYTTAGTHKDDLEFVIENYPIKKYASQGQQKSYLIALKLAQYDFIKELKNEKPILLLDDIYDKLDEARVTQLMRLVTDKNFGQLFVTDTHPERLAKIFKTNDTNYNLYAVNNGTISMQTEKQEA